MTALAFDPWEGLERRTEDSRPTDRDGPGGAGLGALAGLAGVASSPLEIGVHTEASEPDYGDDDAPPPPALVLPVIPLAEMVEAMAEAMMANPTYRIANRDKAMVYFRANALTRLTATNDP